MGRRRLHERRHGMGFARDESNEQRASEEMSGGGAVCTGNCQSAWVVKERSTELDCGQLMSRERRAIGERRLDGAVASLHRWGPRTHSVLDYCTTGRSFRAIASRRLCPVGMVFDEVWPHDPQQPTQSGHAMHKTTQDTGPPPPRGLYNITLPRPSASVWDSSCC